MTSPPVATHSAIETALVGRSENFFSPDLAAFDAELRERIGGRRFLFIGAAGSIGSRTLRTVLHYRPAAVHVVDHNENGLAELVRWLRSDDEVRVPEEFVTLPFDYGSPSFEGWFAAKGDTFDHVLDFAALKHVRSEKDPYSILAMLDTNVFKLVRLLRRLRERPRAARLFCVSTDKAANPSSMMGATKRLMEHALFFEESHLVRSSARFANVALSNGSLLQSWENRIALGQPLACPNACRRYFVSLQESGHLCTLAAMLGETGRIIVPRLDPEDHLVLLSDIAARYLEARGFTPHFVHDEGAARAALSTGFPEPGGRYPVLLTPLDTAGEKPYEEFVAEGETLTGADFRSLDAVAYRPPKDGAAFPAFLDWLEGQLDPGGTATEDLDAETLHRRIAEVEPAFARTYRKSALFLDNRM